MTDSHKNSKRVTIFRANNFMVKSQDQKDGGVADFIGLSNKNIGPFFASHTAKILGSGLDLGEQRILLPLLLSVSKEDKDFPKLVSEFYNNIVTKIPPNSGKEFEIGLLEDNTQPISENNLPIKLEDYIRYRHAKAHPWTAGTKKEADGNQLKYFYIHDTDQQVREEDEKLALHDKADSIWAKVKEDKSKLRMLLTLMGGDERNFTGKQETVDTKIKLDLNKRINDKPGKFIEVYEDQRFEIRYWLTAMLNVNVLKEVGTSIVISSNDKVIGNSTLEAILYLEKKENQDTVMHLKGLTQEVLRKPKNRKEVK